MPDPGIDSPDYLFGLSRSNTAAGSCRRRGPNGIFSRRLSAAASAVLLSRVFRRRIIREKVARNTVRHPDPRVPHRVLRQVRIARGRLHLRVTEQPADHWKRFPERQRPGRVAMAAIVESACPSVLRDRR